jgi:hypothetical protein
MKCIVCGKEDEKMSYSYGSNYGVCNARCLSGPCYIPLQKVPIGRIRSSKRKNRKAERMILISNVQD